MSTNIVIKKETYRLSRVLCLIVDSLAPSRGLAAYSIQPGMYARHGKQLISHRHVVKKGFCMKQNVAEIRGSQLKKIMMDRPHP